MEKGITTSDTWDPRDERRSLHAGHKTSSTLDDSVIVFE